MKDYKTKIAGTAIPSYIRPLFWQHGETRDILCDEIQKMYESGIGGFIVEARPHPDFLSYGWWRDLDILVEEAKKRNMEVWIFDDSAYPSGFGAGKIKDLYPEELKIYMRKFHVDAMGPMEGSYINLDILPAGDKLIRIIAGKRANGTEQLVESTLIDITDHVKVGRLYWDIPEGPWRIFFIASTREGGEEETKDYVNPISPSAVKKYIDIIYEEHYKHYKEEFGKTIKGFFVDEPRYGSDSSYESLLGEANMVLPYAPELLEELSKELDRDCSTLLPLLWSKENLSCPDVHYTYMNVVSRLFGEAFGGQIGDWCRAHDVSVIGHVVEDNGAHARLGFGCGHFFRSLDGFDTSGLDIVYQIWPEYTSGRHQTPFGYLNANFYYWGIGKLASSLAHLDPKKHGITICEVFGAYGWQEGLKLMKWLTDHITVRGINLIVPHAFSPKFPDPDCPPHFYARGNNPQWPYFGIWSAYANRVCHLLSGGIHKATAAVLYHAEAEWGGAYEPFEDPVKALMEQQIDCDVVPVDYLIDATKTTINNRRMQVEQEFFEVLIIPYAKYLPESLLKTLVNMAKAGLQIVFLKAYPERAYLTTDVCAIEAIKEQECITVMPTESLAEWMKENGYYEIKAEAEDTKALTYLRCMHVEKDGHPVYFFTNEGKYNKINAEITLKDENNLTAYDAMKDQYYPLRRSETNPDAVVIELSPYQSLFVVDEKPEVYAEAVPCTIIGAELLLQDGWTMTTEKMEATEILHEQHTLTNLAVPKLLPTYSGRIIFTNTFSVPKETMGEKIYLDLGSVYEVAEVWINGVSVGIRICPPYTYDVTDMVTEENTIRIEVVNTFAKEKGDNIFDCAMPQEPTGLLGPVRIVTNNAV